MLFFLVYMTRVLDCVSYATTLPWMWLEHHSLCATNTIRPLSKSPKGWFMSSPIATRQPVRPPPQRRGEVVEASTNTFRNSLQVRSIPDAAYQQALDSS